MGFFIDCMLIIKIREKRIKKLCTLTSIRLLNSSSLALVLLLLPPEIRIAWQRAKLI
jgi:hypothetical protein